MGSMPDPWPSLRVFFVYSIIIIPQHIGQGVHAASRTVRDIQVAALSRAIGSLAGFTPCGFGDNHSCRSVGYDSCSTLSL